MAKCFICDNDIDESGVDFSQVSLKGIRSLIKASDDRKDNKGAHLVGLKSLKLHTSCRRDYTRPSSIAAYEAQQKRQTAGSSSKPQNEPTPVSLRSSTTNFDFKTTCFLCCEFIGNVKEYREKEAKKPFPLRKRVCEVMTFSITETCMRIATERNDKWGDDVFGRLSSVNDLVAEEAVYHEGCRNKFYKKYQKKSDRDYVSEAMEDIYYFMRNNGDSQFTMQELRDAVSGEIPDDKIIKSRLLEKFGDQVIITKGANRFQPSLICFADTGYKVLTDSWYESKVANAADERLRVVKTAGQIIRQDIQRQVYNTSTYPPRDDFLRDVERCIPPTLFVFLEELMLKKTKAVEQNRKKCIAIAHAIISNIRPRTFSSSIMNSLALLLYRKYASKNLVNLIANLGFCASYYDAQKLEMSAVLYSQPSFKAGSFIQFVFDNADFNVCTLDGMNTFHAMGGIACITPSSSLERGSEIPKLSSSNEVGMQGVIPLEIFHAVGTGLRSVTVTDLAVPEQPARPTEHDALWLYAKWQQTRGIPEWKGYMHSLTKGMYSEKTKVIPLPFINAPPSDYDTVYTALKMASELCEKVNQKCLIITFDQPLYSKCIEIVASSPPDTIMSNAIVRLGGFHLLMSFLGCIGYLMGGSGLKEVLSTVYAPLSVDHMLQGHAFARAVRGHILVQTALSKIVFSQMDITDDEQKNIDQIMTNFLDDSPSVSSLHDNPHLISLANKLGQHLTQLNERGRTAQLWIQYYKMVSLVKEYIHAERSGIWELHLECVKKMVPYFHASGHFPYAKSCQLYLQDMENLSSNMTTDEYQKFVGQGYFTMRRSDRFWTGVWSDMTIETTLMRGFKSRSGLTSGRGTTDSVISKWVLGTTATHDICTSLEEFCGVLFAASEQHVDFSVARRSRDADDIAKMSLWFENHNPFPITEEIMSIASGVVGDDTITCYKAVVVGKEAMSKIVGTSFSDLKLSRKSRAFPLSSLTTSIKIKGDPVVIDPLLIFQRISINKQSYDDLKTYLRYELAPFPLALFDDAGMRKTKKSALYSSFDSTTDINLSDFEIVIDGGFLLHRVLWPTGSTISSICEIYLKYIKRHYPGKTCSVVFDGYNTTANSTKCAEQRRRYRIKQSVNINCTADTIISVKQDHFLSNELNKSRLIAILTSYLQENGVMTDVAEDDADNLIVSTAIQKQAENVVIVGEDIDLVVLVMTLTPEDRNIMFLKPSHGKTKTLTFSSKDLQQLGLKHILFIHAFTGCDTTSAAFRKGKMNFLKLYKQHADIQAAAQVFTDQDSSPAQIEEAGKTCFLKWYGAPPDELSLNNYRYLSFMKSVSKIKPDISALPPTEGAAKQHSFRVYLQVQSWLGRRLPPQQWGWEQRRSALGTEELIPVLSTDLRAPDDILNLLFCKCTKGCTGGKCSCRKAGLNCSPICNNCHGQCFNGVPFVEEDESQSTEVLPIESFETDSVGDTDNPDDPADPEPPPEPLPGPSRPKRVRTV